MNENVWDKIVELGREYIELRAEDDRLTAIMEETPPQPDLIESLEQFLAYSFALSEREKVVSDCTTKRIKVRAQLARLQSELMPILPFRIWVRVDDHKFRVYENHYGRSMDFERVNYPINIPF